MAATNDERDQKFAARIQQGIATCEAWEDDPSLLAECRLMIPFAELMPELQAHSNSNSNSNSNKNINNNNNINNTEEMAKKDNPYAGDKDCLYHGNTLFLARLAKYFQNDVMTWVNAPPCKICGSIDQMQAQETRGPESQEELEGQASRVEVYKCQGCGDAPITTFPRYNSVRKLLETRQGRCGEYANLFGLYCRSAGFETRYVADWTDHVWIEVLVGDEWIMADSCEGTINEPSMYESGWGKKLNYTVGIQAAASVIDLTPRYTRQFYSADFQERRRQITSSEAASDTIVRRCNDRMRKGLSQKKKEELQRRDKVEQAQLIKYKSTTEWTNAEKHGRGRISGSLEWRIQRREAGKDKATITASEEEASSVRSLYVEQFYPAKQGPFSVSVFPIAQPGILVAGTNCDVGQPDWISAVLLDDVHLGCILQCRSFALWSDLASYLQSIPPGRIVVLKQNGTKEKDFTNREMLEEQMNVLGGFQLPTKPADGVVFIGRVVPTGVAYPAWTRCSSYTECEPSGLHVHFPGNITRSETKLRAERRTVPQRVVGRLPESTMPLATQMLASETQKRVAFESYSKTNPSIVGYTTKQGSPVYLMDNSSFSFQATQGEWTSFHLLPDVLVPDNEIDTGSGNNADEPPMFVVPLEEGFFKSLLGPSLLVRSGAGSVTLPTVDALRNKRLIGLYFSAHWCPPCRKFTPMLSEAYAHLKETFVYQGLEIVFVSSDRSDDEFKQYYGTMPWSSVPYDRMAQQGISARYGVRGIPALVILDAISGQIVASIEQSRQEVAQACQRGDSEIEELFQNWIIRIPDDSRELFNLLELSSTEGEAKDAANVPPSRNAYLVRNEGSVNPLSKAGDNPPIKNLDFGAATTTVSNRQIVLPKGDEAKVALQTILKYLDNAVKEPWNPKFRQFKVNNKIVDKAMRAEGSLDLISSLGLLVVPTMEDFMISVPLGADLDRIHSRMTKAIEGC